MTHTCTCTCACTVHVCMNNRCMCTCPSATISTCTLIVYHMRWVFIVLQWLKDAPLCLVCPLPSFFPLPFCLLPPSSPPRLPSPYHEQLASIMDKCRSHFSSSDPVQSVPDAERLLSTLHELRDLVQQATDGVRSQGKQLVEVLAAVTESSPTQPRTEFGSRSPMLDSRSYSVVDDVSDLDSGKRRPLETHSTGDLIDGVEVDGEGDGSDESAEGGGGEESHRLLVSPRKSRPGLKSYKSSSSSLALSPDQVSLHCT